MKGKSMENIEGRVRITEDTVRESNRVSEGKGKEMVFEDISTGNFPHMVRCINLQIQDQYKPSWVSQKKCTARLITVRLQKTKRTLQHG
jgi:hypothetical protein